MPEKSKLCQFTYYAAPCGCKVVTINKVVAEETWCSPDCPTECEECNTYAHSLPVRIIRESYPDKAEQILNYKGFIRM